MAPQPPPDQPSGIDPLLDRQFARDHQPSGPNSQPDRPRTGARRHGASGAGRPHAARGARAVALTASVLATGAIGSALAYSEGAFSADGGTVDDGLVESSSVAVAFEDDAAPSPSVTTPTTETTEATVEEPTAATTTAAPDATTTPSTTTETDTGSWDYADGVFLGTSEYTEWGDVQVEVTISGGQIIDVAAVDYPQGRRSSDINSRAIPLLEADAIELQSAVVDVVSGATYTSRTYADSLQAALDTAAMAAASEPSA